MEQRQIILKLYYFDDMKITYRVFWSAYEDGVFGECGEYADKSEAIRVVRDISLNIAEKQPHHNCTWRVKNNKCEIVDHGECRNGDRLTTTS